jgi:hypothetical protein
MCLAASGRRAGFRPHYFLGRSVCLLSLFRRVSLEVPRRAVACSRGSEAMAWARRARDILAGGAACADCRKGSAPIVPSWCVCFLHEPHARPGEDMCHRLVQCQRPARKIPVRPCLVLPLFRFNRCVLSKVICDVPFVLVFETKHRGLRF